MTLLHEFLMNLSVELHFTNPAACAWIAKYVALEQQPKARKGRRKMQDVRLVNGARAKIDEELIKAALREAQHG